MRRWAKRAFIAWPPIMGAVLVTAFAAAYGDLFLVALGVLGIVLWMYAGIKFGGD